MDKREIQIRFPRPGEWGRFKGVGVYEVDGWLHQRVFTGADVPVGLVGAFEGVVGVLAGLGEVWQAVCVRARLGVVYNGGVSAPLAQGVVGEEHSSSVPEEGRECVVLTVWARRDGGGVRRLEVGDYPQFLIRDAGAVEFFKYFTV